MRILAGIVASVVLAATGAGAQTVPTGLTGEVFRAESEFDAYTAEHGMTEGFHAYSTPDAIAFRPEAVRIHERLGDAIAKGEGGKDAPSKLRWRPYRIAVAASGDMAWDMGPWTVEGSDRAGWFFTIWRKQADGRWLWSLDTGAGTDTANKLPPAGAYETLSFTSGPPANPDAANSAAKRDAELNAALSAKPPAEAYKTFSMEDLTYFGGGAVPASGRKVVKALLGARPQQGATWTTVGKGQSAAGDMVYTYGHVTDATGAHLGHYVRVWTPMAGWQLAVDLYNSAK